MLEVVDAQNTLTAARNAFNDGRERYMVGTAHVNNFDRNYAFDKPKGDFTGATVLPLE